MIRVGKVGNGEDVNPNPKGVAHVVHMWCTDGAHAQVSCTTTAASP